jgi:membrane-associated protease RseP (regulator of RpoE activity)
MVNFIVYDLVFLVLFSAWVVWFLRSRKKQLSREGIIFMYRTQFGVKAIKYIGEKFKGFLGSIRYLIIAVGFVLMGSILWMFGQTVSIYWLHPEITAIIKAPPVAPLIPYFPKLFGLESFFPDFYFTYFIVALAIVAIVHEFSHGIFMKLFKVKIKSTGLVFLGPILGAFVEEERKDFEKKKKIEQMTILAAGVFANVIFALIFYGLYVGFFFSSFAASGYIFDSYAVSPVPIADINNLSVSENYTVITTNNATYYLDEVLAVQLDQNITNYLIAYPDTPAFSSQMKGVIVQGDDMKITNQDKLREFLNSKEPGDNVTFVTEYADELIYYNIILDEHPNNSSKAYLGVGNTALQPRGAIQMALKWFMSFRDPSTFYKPIWNADFVNFTLYLFWWIMIINLLVAMFNMLPLGILDGGRFFYLTMLGISGSKRFAKFAYKFMGYAILFSLLLLMFFWFIRII